MLVFVWAKSYDTETCNLAEQCQVDEPWWLSPPRRVSTYAIDKSLTKKGIKDVLFFQIKASFVSNSSIASMAFKKSLAALVFALPLVLGMNPNFQHKMFMCWLWMQLRQIKCDPRHVTPWMLSRPICLTTCSTTSVVIRSVFCPLIMSIYLKTLKAHGALRLAFHDAIGFSPTLG